MSHKRRKGTAIVDTSKGIVVVAGRSKRFILPGGGANKSESRRKAAIRELHEETGLKAKSTTYLFSYVGSKWRTHNATYVRNHATVFLIKAYGTARPRHEIKYIGFWKPGSDLYLTNGTQKIINKYLNEYKA